MSESDIVKGCLDLLALKKIFAFRINNTGIYDPARKCFRTFHGKKGVSDILGIAKNGTKIVSKGCFIAVECKMPKGKLTETQDEFQEEVVEAGGIALTAHSVDELAEDLKELGF